MYYESAYFGMNFFWWCFWILLWIGFFSMLTPVPRKQWQKKADRPLDVIMQRLAKGEITELEYESRKSIIQRDSKEDLAPQRSWKVGYSKPLKN